jgi:hypothetical protein
MSRNKRTQLEVIDNAGEVQLAIKSVDGDAIHTLTPVDARNVVRAASLVFDGVAERRQAGVAKRTNGKKNGRKKSR